MALQGGQWHLLKVGPDSAGLAPGPACYARGGTAPTVTDADLVLGLLDADNFLGGDMKLDGGASEAAAITLVLPLMRRIRTAPSTEVRAPSHERSPAPAVEGSPG